MEYKIIPVKEIQDQLLGEESNSSSLEKHLLSARESDWYATGCLKWNEFCKSSGIYGVDKINLESQHCMRISSVDPGYLDLIEGDSFYFDKLLMENNGSRDAIKATRKWIIERAHSIVAIGLKVKQFIESRDNTVFDRILHTLYVVNDVLYNMHEATTFGPYTTFVQQIDKVQVIPIWTSLIISIMQSSVLRAENDTQRERVTRLVKLWESKQFLDADSFRMMYQAIAQPHLSQSIPPFLLASPYLICANTPFVGNQQPEKPQVRAFHPSSSFEHSPSIPLDISKLSVGQMILTLKAFSKIVPQKYHPVDFALMNGVVSDDTEKGRLEVRVEDFYRKVNERIAHGKRKSNYDAQSNQRDYSEDDRSYRKSWRKI